MPPHPGAQQGPEQPDTASQPARRPSEGFLPNKLRAALPAFVRNEKTAGPNVLFKRPSTTSSVPINDLH